MDGQVAAATRTDLDRTVLAVVVADDRFPGDESVKGVLNHQPVTTLAKTLLHDLFSFALYRVKRRVSFLLTQREYLINNSRTLCQLLFYTLLFFSAHSALRTNPLIFHRYTKKAPAARLAAGAFQPI
jgi:hypothetical protein